MTFKEWLTNTWRYMLRRLMIKCVGLTTVGSLMVLVSCSSCSSSKLVAKVSTDTLASNEARIVKSCVYEPLPIKANATYILRNDWDLGGKVYKIPEGVILKSNGSVFVNGTLIGDNTKIISDGAIFRNITIEGTWDVHDISTRLFVDLKRDNSIKNVFALANDSVANRIFVESDQYRVSASSFGAAIKIKSNTIVELNGTISLMPNNYKGCSVMEVRDASNVQIHGNGIIVGDQNNHLGEDGEWGHGLNIINSRNVKITHLRVENCWGDCIYVGNESRDILITHCVLSSSRRQGISVTSASNIIITNCAIDNIRGTNPQYAIDIEPNENESVLNVIIDNLEINNCYGGLMVYGRHKGCIIDNVHFYNCKISNTEAKYPMCFTECNHLTVGGCSIDSGDRTSLLVEDNENVLTYNNNLISTNKIPYKVINCKKISATEKYTKLK